MLHAKVDSVDEKKANRSGQSNCAVLFGTSAFLFFVFFSPQYHCYVSMLFICIYLPFFCHCNPSFMCVTVSAHIQLAREILQMDYPFALSRNDKFRVLLPRFPCPTFVCSYTYNVCGKMLLMYLR